ncbi:protein detoxification 35 [Gossypium australe]|uniref:Protein detoxification 35 n=1 Tax=Gossypium australe TaxID=47621 RepID=A0A5B6WYN3_9ROSI|nr:protein detoxification 35 [Gossypium australe]
MKASMNTACIKFLDTFSLVAKQDTLNDYCTYSSFCLGFVYNAFLQRGLHEKVYMTLPDSFHNHGETRVYRLLKSSYGLKQASR